MSTGLIQLTFILWGTEAVVVPELANGANLPSGKLSKDTVRSADDERHQVDVSSKQANKQTE